MENSVDIPTEKYQFSKLEGFRGKDMAASKIAPKSSIYLIIKNFKERGSIVVKTASGRPRKSTKRQDHLLKLIQLQDRGPTSAEVAQEWQQAGSCRRSQTLVISRDVAHLG
ncbi:unnamed protein product [Pleuronectes platessa]|uniref:Uncharacterized protein n=1 Tax=Pleuronectes platessa TaxID=8262 RepID=A0A9N7URF9_PLEPL|nr:unnamed protein product [Pleuronectes platessa]